MAENWSFRLAEPADRSDPKWSKRGRTVHFKDIMVAMESFEESFSDHKNPPWSLGNWDVCNPRDGSSPRAGVGCD